MTRKISKFILFVQLPFLVYLTLLGFFICVGAILPILSGSITKEHLTDCFAGILILMTLVAGWRIWVWVLTDGPSKNKPIHKIWWLFVLIGASLTLLSVTLELTGKTVIMPFSDLYLMGAYFMPSLFHIISEIYWQRKASHSLKQGWLRRGRT